MFDRSHTKVYSTLIREASLTALGLYFIGSLLLWTLNTEYFEPFLLRITYTILSLLAVIIFIKPRKTRDLASSAFVMSISLIALGLEFFVAKEHTFQASWLSGCLMMMMLTLGLLQSNRQIVFYFLLVLFLFYTLLLNAPGTIAFTPKILAVNITTILIVSLISGILRRRFLKEQLGKQEALTTIFSTLDHGIIFQKADGDIFFANKSAEQILGVTFDQLIGKSSADPVWKTYLPNGSICPPENYPSSIAQAKGEKVLNFKMRLHRSDNTWADLSVSAVPVIDPQTNQVMHTVVTIQDETEKLKILNSIESLNRSLDLASRFASMGKIANHLAVEIKKPLFEIEDVLRKSKNNPNKSSDLDESIQRIEKSVKKIDQVVTSFVNLHIQSIDHQFNWIFIKDILLDIKSLFAQKIKEGGIEFTYDIPDSLTIYGNQTSIALALEDLIENSIEAVSQLKEKWIHISVSQKDDKSVFRIIDSGRGIPKPLQEKIFQPYFTTKKNDGHHFGMGLIIAQSIARSHNGSLRFDHSVPNTCVELTLQNQPVPT